MRSFRVITCTYIVENAHAWITCVSGDAVIDVAAHQTFLLASTCVFSLSLSLFLSLSLCGSFSFFGSLVSFRSRLFHARECALPHASRNWSRECNRPRASSCCSGSDSYNATAMRITRRIITAAPLSSRVTVPRLPALVSSETCVLYRQRVPRLDAAERCSCFCTPAKMMTGEGCRCGSRFYEQNFRFFFCEKIRENLNSCRGAKVQQNITLIIFFSLKHFVKREKDVMHY